MLAGMPELACGTALCLYHSSCAGQAKGVCHLRAAAWLGKERSCAVLAPVATGPVGKHYCLMMEQESNLRGYSSSLS